MRNPPNIDNRPVPVFRMITVGPLEWTQGFEYVLMAIRQCVEVTKPIHLDLVAYGRTDKSEKQRVLYTIEDLQLHEYASLLVCHTPDDVRALLSRADLYVHSSLRDELSPGVLEALSWGLPVVTTDGVPIREIVAAAGQALIVPARNPNALARAMYTLMADAASYRRVGAAGRRDLQALPQRGHYRLLPAAISSFGVCDRG